MSEYRAAVIPTRDRHDMLRDLVWSLTPQVDRVIIVDNGSWPEIEPGKWGLPIWWSEGTLGAIRVDEDPPNISRLWNTGLRLAEEEALALGCKEWDVAVLNSDVIVPRGWMHKMATAMRSTSAVLAYPDQFGGREQILHTRAKPVPLTQRITGYAHMMRGEAGLRYDECMAWWYSDDDMDWTARERGGSLLVPWLEVEHRDPNGSTNARPELQEQATRDRETFRTKWGRTPH